MFYPGDIAGKLEKKKHGKITYQPASIWLDL